nr:uncharacterized protein C16orf95 homolog isoform X6 [Macaca nemestrina]
MPRCWVTRQERPLHAPNMVFLLPGSQGASGLLEPTASPADNEGMDEGAKRGKQRVPILASAFLDSITAQPCTQSKGLSQLGVPGFSFVKKPRCQQVLMGPNTTGARVPGREAAGSEAEGLSVLRREPGRAVFHGCRPSP